MAFAFDINARGMFGESPWNGDRRRKDALSFLLAQLQTAAINRRAEELPDAEATAVLQKQVRQREESLEAARKADPAFDSGLLAKGGTFSFMFTTASGPDGFAYVCTPHAAMGMKGRC